MPYPWRLIQVIGTLSQFVSRHSCACRERKTVGDRTEQKKERVSVRKGPIVQTTDGQTGTRGCHATAVWSGDGHGNATWRSVQWFNQLAQLAINHHQDELPKPKGETLTNTRMHITVTAAELKNSIVHWGVSGTRQDFNMKDFYLNY